MAEVKLANITKVFDRQVMGLKDLTLQIKDGEFFTILGPSGSGKSTILRVIAGLERQDKGDVFIDGVNVNESLPQQRNIAFVFQSYALYPHMNVYENIAVGLRIKGYSQKDIRSRIDEVAKLLEIPELLKRKPKALSGGQRQRVALARAIAKRPKVFLLDEPLSNLDASLREKMRTELKTLFKKLKATVIYVTHDQQEAMGLSDRIAIIDKGQLKQIGLSDELYSHPKNLFVASFLGSPKINTFEVMVEDGSFVLGSVRLRLPQEYGVRIKNLNRIFLGIRAEDVRVYPDKKPNTFAVSVIMIEKMGKYSILTLDLQGQTFKSIIDNEFTCKLDNNVWVEFNERRLYLFNTDTQEAV